MIEFLKKDDFCKVIKLWNLVFGDSEDDIKSYLENFWDSLVVFKECDNVVGMTSLIPIMGGRYVYAVATHPDFRGRGVASKLLDWAKDFIIKNKEDFLLLVPAEDSLFDFYKKHNFSPIYCTTKQEFSASELIKTSSKAMPVSPEELYELRKKHFSDKTFVEWDLKVLGYAYNMYKCGFFRVSGGFAVCVKYNDTAYVKELFSDDIRLALSELHNRFGASNYIVTLPENGDKPNAMIFGKYPSDIYFNLALD